MSDNIRTAVRALVIDHDNHVLMVRLDFPNGSWWVLPGGGIEPGEDEITALHRELREEVGLVDAQLSGHVWSRTHLFRMTDPSGREWDGQSENVHLVRTARFDPVPHLDDKQLARENLMSHRWWSVDEIESHDAENEHFAPRGFAGILRAVITDGVPDEPFVLFQED